MFARRVAADGMIALAVTRYGSISVAIATGDRRDRRGRGILVGLRTVGAAPCVVDDDAGTVRRQPLDVGPADAAPTSGDDGDTPLEHRRGLVHASDRTPSRSRRYPL